MKKLLHSIGVLSLLSGSLLASDPAPWMRHPSITDADEAKTGTIMTWYWTFDPDNASAGWDEWAREPWSTDSVKLNGTDITMTRNMADKFNLEGSGWYTDDGDHRVINIVEPHVEVDSTIFVEVPFVDYGLDAPHYHFGLVPFRTVAAVHDDIPAGTWVYIPMFDGVQIPVYNLDDRSVLDDYFWHDGWFRVTDISWSFADDATQIDIFAGTVNAVDEVYGQLWDNFEQVGIWNETKQEYQYLDTYTDKVSFVYRSDVPVYENSNGTVYRYATTVDTVHNDTKAQEFLVSAIPTGNNHTYAVDIDGDGFRNDLIVWNRSTSTFSAFANFNAESSNTSASSVWSIPFENAQIRDVAVGDYNGSGSDAIVMATADGIYGSGVLNSTASFTKISDEVVDELVLADINNDDKQELVVRVSNSLKTASYGSGAYNPFTSLSMTFEGDITALSAGDITAEGQDEIIVGTSKGIYSHDFSGNASGLLASDISSPDDLTIGYVDPDGFADIYAVHDNKIKVKYSSHKVGAPFVSIGSTTSKWISVATINPKQSGSGIPVATKRKEFSPKSSPLQITKNMITVRSGALTGSMHIYGMNGRLLGKLSGQRHSEETLFDLSTLSLSLQPVVVTVEIDGQRFSQRMMVK